MINKYIIQTCYVIFSILFLVYVIYKSEIVSAGLKHEFYFKYYLISAFLVLLSLFSFFIKKELNLKIFTILLATFASLYLIEFYLFSTKVVRKDYLNEFTKDFEKEKPKRVPMFYPFNFVNEKNQKIFPFGGVSNSETIFCFEDYLVKYKSDKFGFNNPNEIWDQKKINILLIGDSFTHGACVFPENNIRSKIQKHGLDLNVLNLGIGGSGPLMQYAILKEYFDLVNPSKVLWIYYEENDIYDLIFEKKNIILNNYLNNRDFKQNIDIKQNEIDKKIIRNFQKRLKTKNSFIETNLKPVKNFFKLKELRFFLKNIFFLNETYYSIPDDFKKILIETRNFLEINNTELYFVYLPEKRRFSNASKIDENKFNNYSEIIKIVEELKIPVINIYEEVFKKNANPLNLFAKNGGHFSVDGYNLTALAILNFIDSK